MSFLTKKVFLKAILKNCFLGSQASVRAILTSPCSLSAKIFLQTWSNALSSSKYQIFKTKVKTIFVCNENKWDLPFDTIFLPQNFGIYIFDKNSTSKKVSIKMKQKTFIHFHLEEIVNEKWMMIFERYQKMIPKKFFCSIVTEINTFWLAMLFFSISNTLIEF